jgi:hypothetical protein
MRISGARSKHQLNKIIQFMNILLYLYTDTYLYKTKERQVLKDRLKKLTNIAKRRNKVEDIIEANEVVRTVKAMTKLDKERIGFKPEKGQHQWTRACQNSGTDKKRRPQQFTDDTIEKLVDSGYEYNNANGNYEKKFKMTVKGKMKDITLTAVKMGTSTGENIYYTCNPQENKEHMYVGFLSRGNNPYGHCMPCCFKKDQKVSQNISKKNYYLKCTNQLTETIAAPKKIIGDKLYILRDTNKVQEGRFSSLPDLIDVFFNKSLNKINVIKNHYLISSPGGYFFKYGTKQDKYPLFNAVSATSTYSVEDIINNMVLAMEKDNNLQIFTSLNNGDVRTRFGTVDKFIDYIKNNDYLDINILGDFLMIPGIASKDGLNIFIFEKKTRIMKESLEKKRIQEDFLPLCLNKENTDFYHDHNRDNIILIKEHKKYFPIFLVAKGDKFDRKIMLKKVFKYEKKDDNIINHILKYYKMSCSEILFKPNIKILINNDTAKSAYKKLSNLGIQFKNQIIDQRNKCKFLVTKDNIIIPVKQSGSIYNLNILKDISNVVMNFDEMVEKLYKYNKKVPSNMKLNPTGVYFINVSGKTYKISSIIINNTSSIPIKNKEYTQSKIMSIAKKYKIAGFVIENNPIYDVIDREILKGEENIIVDKRILMVNNRNYTNESYELFRLEFSNFLRSNDNIMKKIERLLINKKLSKNEKRNKIKKIIFRISNKELYDLFIKLLTKGKLEGGAMRSDRTRSDRTRSDRTRSDRTQSGGSHDVQLGLRHCLEHHLVIVDSQSGGDQRDGQLGGSKFIHTYTKDKNLSNYTVKNNRNVCEVYKKDTCDGDVHCHWINDTCKLSLDKEMIITFINKLSEELVGNNLKLNELLGKDQYFVSDIVDYNVYTVRPDQKIIKSSRANITKILGELFGKDKIPIIGRRKVSKLAKVGDENLTNPLKIVGNLYIQNIISNNDTIFRAYSNGFAWIMNNLYDTEFRNIGYYGELQTKLANYFKSTVIDWLNDKKHKNLIDAEIKNHFKDNKYPNYIQKYVVKMAMTESSPSRNIVELFVLSLVNEYPIMIYNNYNNIIMVIDNGTIYNKNFSSYDKLKTKQNAINIRYNFMGENKTPASIDVMYWK